MIRVMFSYIRYRYYPLSTKLLGGNVFTDACLSTGVSTSGPMSFPGGGYFWYQVPSRVGIFRGRGRVCPWGGGEYVHGMGVLGVGGCPPRHGTSGGWVCSGGWLLTPT